MTRSGNRAGSYRTALIAFAFFALGLLAARLFGLLSPSAPAPDARSAAPPGGELPATASPSVTLTLESDAGGPRILFDPASISLLPDASLTIELPAMPDASTSPP